MAIILDGKALSAKIKEQLKLEIDQIKDRRKPKLVVVIVGDNPASLTYVQAKAKACKQIGMESEIVRFPATITQQHLLSTITDLNNDQTVDGILVQLPLPKHLNEQAVIVTLDPNKDVDGFHPLNVGYLHSKQPGFVPCTPKGVVALLDAYQIDLKGKRVLVIGRSHLVGRPVAQLLVDAHATVTIAHSRSLEIEKLCQEADVIVAAAGVESYIKKEWVKPNAVVVDVGIHRLEDGSIVGDVDKGVMDVASYITPVPGGIGPMTIAMLLSNTMDAYHQHIQE